MCIFIYIQETTILAKRLSFTEDSVNQDIILGIATDARSWKLCYEINHILEINLKNTSHFYPNSENPTLPASREVLNLPVDPFFQERFEDVESVAHTEYLLYTKDPQKLPKESKPFRFFLLIRSISVLSPVADIMIRRLMKVDIIHSVVNFSDYKHLQHLLP